MQHHLDDADSPVDQPLLEGVDRAVAPLDLGVIGEVADPPDQHVLVVRPVEHANEPRFRHALLDAPEEVVRELFGGRLLECRERHPLRVDRADHVAHDAALAGGVHPLQHEEHRGRAVDDARLGVEALLQVVELVDARREVCGGTLFPLLVPGRRPRVDGVEAEARPRPQQIGGVIRPMGLARRSHAAMMADCRVTVPVPPR